MALTDWNFICTKILQELKTHGKNYEMISVDLNIEVFLRVKELEKLPEAQYPVLNSMSA